MNTTNNTELAERVNDALEANSYDIDAALAAADEFTGNTDAPSLFEGEEVHDPAPGYLYACAFTAPDGHAFTVWARDATTLRAEAGNTLPAALSNLSR